MRAPGINHLKDRFVSLSKEPLPKIRNEDREVIGYGSSGPVYADVYSERHRKSVVTLALQEIADAQGDVDAFITQKSKEARGVPAVAAQIATRLLAAGRTEEAWAAINAVDEDRRDWIPFEWEQVKIEVLEALGRDDEAGSVQVVRVVWRNRMIGRNLVKSIEEDDERIKLELKGSRDSSMIELRYKRKGRFGGTNRPERTILNLDEPSAEPEEH